MSDSPLPWGLEFEVDAGEGLAAAVGYDPAGCLLTVTVRNAGDAPATIRAVTLRAPLDLAAAGGCAWLTGHAPASAARVVSLGTVPAEPDGRLVEVGPGSIVLRSAIVLGLDLPVRAESALVLGLAGLRGADASVRLTLNAAGTATEQLAITVESPPAEVAPGAVCALPAIFLASGRDLLALYEDFADAAATATGARPVSRPPVCWLAPPDPAALASGLGALTGAELGVDTVVVAQGDANEVATVTAAGLRAGVQLAAHDDAALRAAIAAGATWFSVSGLDDAPVADARTALQRVRDTIGDGGYLHAADAPFAACLGLADACAVGGPGAAALARWWMDGAWWTNDSGAVLPLDGQPSSLDLAVSALSGGMVTLDGAPAPGAKAAAILPPTGVAARPVAIAGEPIPFAWRASLDEGRYLHGLVNPTGAARWAVAFEQLRPGEVAFDQLRGRLPGMGDPLVGAHEAVLWLVHAPGPGPRLIGDAASLGGRGLFTRRVSGQLHLRNSLPVARTVAVEARGRAFEVTLAPGQLERIQ